MLAQDRVATPHDRGARTELVALLVLLLGTLAVSFVKGQDVFVFAYIMTVVVAVGGPRRHHRPWSELGVKGGFVGDLRRAWPLVLLVAVVFRCSRQHSLSRPVSATRTRWCGTVTGRLAVDFGSSAGLLDGGAAALVLVEEMVYRVTIQERLSSFDRDTGGDPRRGDPVRPGACGRDGGESAGRRHRRVGRRPRWRVLRDHLRQDPHNLRCDLGSALRGRRRRVDRTGADLLRAGRMRLGAALAMTCGESRRDRLDARPSVLDIDALEFIH